MINLAQSFVANAVLSFRRAWIILEIQFYADGRGGVGDAEFFKSKWIGDFDVGEWSPKSKGGEVVVVQGEEEENKNKMEKELMWN